MIRAVPVLCENAPMDPPSLPSQNMGPSFPPGLRPIKNFLWCLWHQLDQKFSAPLKTQHHWGPGGWGGWTPPPRPTHPPPSKKWPLGGGGGDFAVTHPDQCATSSSSSSSSINAPSGPLGHSTGPTQIRCGTCASEMWLRRFPNVHGPVVVVQAHTVPCALPLQHREV